MVLEMYQNQNGLMYQQGQQPYQPQPTMQQQQHMHHVQQPYQPQYMQMQGHQGQMATPGPPPQQYMMQQVPPDQLGQMAAPTSGIMRGIVKKWNLEKGYGFIQPVDGGDDVFVHHTVIHAQGFRSLMEGSEVEFEACQLAGKTRATQVTGPNGTFVVTAQRQPNPPLVAPQEQMMGMGYMPDQMSQMQMSQMQPMQMATDYPMAGMEKKYNPQGMRKAPGGYMQYPPISA
eukprot:Sspe_Gene.89427::Locus_61195_Transcript_1_1_Confidence_1.000_Length_758::g.89427::m.89427